MRALLFLLVLMSVVFDAKRTTGQDAIQRDEPVLDRW